MAKYIPPQQSRAGQIGDVVLVIVLIFVTLWLPIWLKLAGAEKVHVPVENPTWETLEQNQVMADTWERLGYTEESAAEIITYRYDYKINYIELALLAFGLIGYFVFLFRMSDKEYKEIIAEKFDDDGTEE